MFFRIQGGTSPPVPDAAWVTLDRAAAGRKRLWQGAGCGPAEGRYVFERHSQPCPEEGWEADDRADDQAYLAEGRKGPGLARGGLGRGGAAQQQAADPEVWLPQLLASGPAPARLHPGCRVVPPQAPTRPVCFRKLALPAPRRPVWGRPEARLVGFPRHAWWPPRTKAAAPAVAAAPSSWPPSTGPKPRSRRHPSPPCASPWRRRLYAGTRRWWDRVSREASEDAFNTDVATGAT